jgi:uncharacterized protein with HEPN domain
MSSRSSIALLEDILESADKVMNYTNGLTYDEFVSNTMVIDAVIRNIEIIGEATIRLPDEYKDKCPQIDWHRIRGLRNRIVHDYFGIDYDIIWSVK